MMTPEEHQRDAMLLHDLRHENPKLRKRIEELMSEQVPRLLELEEHTDRQAKRIEELESAIRTTLAVWKNPPDADTREAWLALLRETVQETTDPAESERKARGKL